MNKRDMKSFKLKKENKNIYNIINSNMMCKIMMI